MDDNMTRDAHFTNGRFLSGGDVWCVRLVVVTQSTSTLNKKV
jgi:hypothetical protein